MNRLYTLIQYYKKWKAVCDSNLVFFKVNCIHNPCPPWMDKHYLPYPEKWSALYAIFCPKNDLSSKAVFFFSLLSEIQILAICLAKRVPFSRPPARQSIRRFHHFNNQIFPFENPLKEIISKSVDKGFELILGVTWLWSTDAFIFLIPAILTAILTAPYKCSYKLLIHQRSWNWLKYADDKVICFLFEYSQYFFSLIGR